MKKKKQKQSTGPKRPRSVTTGVYIVAETTQFDNDRSLYIYEGKITARNLARVLKWLPAAIAWRDWRGE
jgi:hypothetical protein